MSSCLTEYGIELFNKPSELCARPIDPVSRGPLANEYGDEIGFFDKKMIALSKRLIQPYITTETHGRNVFDGLYRLLEDIGPSEPLLDLGCGAGQFLYNLTLKAYKDIYGCTIHLGEREYAKNVYGIHTVLALDMREIDRAFKPNSLKTIVAHCCLHFITKPDRQKVINASHKILRPSGNLVVVDYKFNKDTGVDGLDLTNWAVSKPTNYNLMGNLTILQK